MRQCDSVTHETVWLLWLMRRCDECDHCVESHRSPLWAGESHKCGRGRYVSSGTTGPLSCRPAHHSTGHKDIGQISCFYLEVWPFVPVAKDLKDLLKPVGGHWSLIWDKTHHWGDSFFLVHCQPLTNRKAVQGTLNCFPIGQLVVPDLNISTQISNLFSHLWQLYGQRSQIWDNQLTNRKAVQSTLNCSPIGQWLAVG